MYVGKINLITSQQTRRIQEICDFSHFSQNDSLTYSIKTVTCVVNVCSGTTDQFTNHNKKHFNICKYKTTCLPSEKIITK